MNIFNLLTERKQKKENIPVLDTSNLDANSGDALVINGQLNNVQFFQYERGQTECNRIETYRQISKTAEIDEVITDIVNETFIFQREKKAFELDWYAGCTISDQLKAKINDEFDNIYALSDFDDVGAEYLQDFYIDGRFVFQKVVDPKSPKKGIKKLVKLDPLNTLKVKIIPQRDRTTNMINAGEIEEYFVYTNKKMSNQKNLLNNNVYNSIDDVVEGVKLSTSAITYVTSGLTDNQHGITIGHLDKAIVPYNNLKMMEQSMVIFRVVRAPMRRAFYVDVSSLPKSRAEEYMKNMSNRFKSKLVYNSDTGSWVDQRSVISMVEDYFIPRFNESKTTEIQNIEGQSSQEILDEVNYMSDKLYQALNAPKSRYSEDNNMFLFGKSDQIPRDEYRFKKFVDRLRNRFMLVFDDILKTQLILKGIISESDWSEIKRSYFWQYTEDNAFIEYKDAEILSNRIDTVSKMGDLIEQGFYSKTWVRKRILKQTDDEILEIDQQVYKERNQDPNEAPPDNIDSGDSDNTDYNDDDYNSGSTSSETGDEPAYQDNNPDETEDDADADTESGDDTENKTTP